MSNINDTSATNDHDVYLVIHGADGNDYPCHLSCFAFTTVKGKLGTPIGSWREDDTGDLGFVTENGGGQIFGGNKLANNPYGMYNYIDFGAISPNKFYVNVRQATPAEE